MGKEQKCVPAFTRTSCTKPIAQRHHRAAMVKRLMKRKPNLEPQSNDRLSHSEEVTSRRVKFGKSLKSAREVLEEFCSTSNLHGVGYIGDKKRHILDRVWWIFAFSLSAFFCCALIFKAYAKWGETPVIVTFDERQTSIMDIPFPAVTICPGAKIDQTIFNYTHVCEKLWNDPNFWTNGPRRIRPPYNITDEEQKYLKAAFQVCDDDFFNYLEIDGNFTDHSITTLLRKVAPSLEAIMPTCHFCGTNHCEELQETITSKGMCYTFNMLRGEELYTEEISQDYYLPNHSFLANLWNLESGYDPGIDVDDRYVTYPFRAFTIDGGVELYFRTYSKNVASCAGNQPGYLIFLHSPAEVPEPTMLADSITVLNNSEVRVTIKPNVMTASEGIRFYEPNRRGCFFQSDRKLRYLKFYTQRNCELECLSNATLRLCGCVKYSMLRAENTPICGHKNIKCYEGVTHSFKKNVTWLGSEVAENCNCLPACVSIKYETEITQSVFEVKHVIYTTEVVDSILSIAYKTNLFTSLKRSELYGPIDFVASCGGLLGLFIGASFLSIVELMYFFFARLCRRLRAHMKRMKPEEKNQIADDSEVPEIIIYYH